LIAFVIPAVRSEAPGIPYHRHRYGIAPAV